MFGEGLEIFEWFSGRSTSWREGDATEERNGPPNRSWHRTPGRTTTRRSWDDDNLPEWATENMTEGGGTFDSTGAFHGSDDEQVLIRCDCGVRSG